MPVLPITDASDERLADYRNLTDVALRRRIEPERGLYMAEGAKVIARALAAGHLPRSLLVSERWLPSVEHLAPAEIPIYVAPAAVLESVTGYDVHRGALASMRRPALPTVADIARDARLVVVLDGIVDHTNVGAAFRSAAGLGADAVLVSPTCADPLYRRAVKVSMGTVFQVPWTRIEQWPAGLDELRQAGFTVAALALADDAVALEDFADAGHERVALVMGAEGDGLAPDALAAADYVVTIPMAGGVDSLNVAAASAVAVWALRH
ncbi:RNA methyltransferase [Demequina sp. TTPB684]|uniref:TrmH family RNA methyltransferase n=1 Tax=unclassified Demequina TaxID=2620311 RepID=UPI001CF179FA|nr:MULTISPECIES: RNA methyltransferase [unclassified Demequina]MCB2413903.1 RNA methyltransferase [Demequina sp. TTPB684]UPU89409.1 RNA methyltransferase [Demequina sp. TMPB413]